MTAKQGRSRPLPFALHGGQDRNNDTIGDPFTVALLSHFRTTQMSLTSGKDTAHFVQERYLERGVDRRWRELDSP